MENQQQSMTDFERARQALRIMQAALEKAKTTHGDLYTFGDCASVYAAMMNMNNFIDKQENSVPKSSSVQSQNVSSPSIAPPHTPLTLNQNQHSNVVTYQTN